MPSLPFLVTTRVIAGFIAVIPLYVIGLVASYFASRLLVTNFYTQSSGTYDHYFNLFLPPRTSSTRSPRCWSSPSRSS